MKSIALMALSVAALLGVSTISAEAQHKGSRGGGYRGSHGSPHGGSYRPPHLSANGGWQRGDVVLGLGGFSLVTGFGPWGGTYTDPYAWDPYFLDPGYNGFGRPYGYSGG